MVYCRSGWIPWSRNVSLEMLKAGYACVYTSQGAEYSNIENELKAAEAKARSLFQLLSFFSFFFTFNIFSCSCHYDPTREKSDGRNPFSKLN